MKRLLYIYGILFLGITAVLMLITVEHDYKAIDQLGAAQPSIEELLSQLKSLQSQLAAKQAQVQTTYQFTRTLKVGDKGEDVRQLQILLNKDILTQIAVSGDGSQGHETTTFGPATSRAVTKFQEKYKSEILTPNQLTKGTGTVGNATLKKLNALIAVNKTTGTLGSVTVITNNPIVITSTQVQVSSSTQTTNTTNSTTTTTNTTSTSSSLLPPTNCGAPVITSASSASGTVGQAFSYTISITSIAAPLYSISGLPGGLSLSGSKIIGIPSTAGTYNTTITATSNCGAGTKVVTITIAPQQTQTSGVIITPGNGFSDQTAQPSNQGSSSQFGYNDSAIARWDVVPFQNFSGNFNVGVVAFHNSGIQKVSFSVNGGPWTDVSQATANPQTSNTTGVGKSNPNGVVEYWATLRATDFAKDGPVEVRAIVYPNVGVPRVLQGPLVRSRDDAVGNNSLFLYANAAASLQSLVAYVSPNGSDSTGDGTDANPYATIFHAMYKLSQKSGNGTADGGTIYLKQGNHIWAHGFNPAEYTKTANSWVTVTPAPGVASADAPIVNEEYYVDKTFASYIGFNTKLVHFKNITFAPVYSANIMVTNEGIESYLWIDRSTMKGVNINEGTSWWNVWWGVFATDTTLTNNDMAFTDSVLVRNCLADQIGGQGFRGTKVVINSELKNLIPAPGVHPDIYYYATNPINTIIYGLKATENAGGQGIFSNNSDYFVKDAAVIDSIIAPNGIYGLGINTPVTNMYIKNLSMTGPSSWTTTQPATDVVIQDSIFTGTVIGIQVPGVTLINTQINIISNSAYNFVVQSLASVGNSILNILHLK